MGELKTALNREAVDLANRLRKVNLRASEQTPLLEVPLSSLKFGAFVRSGGAKAAAGPVTPRPQRAGGRAEGQAAPRESRSRSPTAAW